MTTIISVDGKLYADRHKIINHPSSGMIGAVQETKLTTTAFCHYATTGFVPRESVRDNLEKALASVFTLLNVINPQGVFSKSPVGKVFYTLPNAVDILSVAINMMTDNIKVKLAKEDVAGIIAVNHRYIVYIKESLVVWTLSNDCYTLGASSIMASILLHHGETIESIYNGICGSTAPTGATYDMLDTSVFNNNLFPPFCDPYFLGNLMGHCEHYINLPDEIGSKEELIKVKHDIVTLVSALTVLGKYNPKTNLITFTKHMTAKLLASAVSPENKIYRRYNGDEPA